ncbi:DUF998 domain-containing protein [Pseudarthrobacter sp. MDT3-28]|uniref:DUF998 domain-containing protein n=1 Tax=Pseudarthrobacter raffinosi TaxID=2953651 RepID=UPI00208E04D8|nr:DUF998 domain-containing protein [Pseudarthrobacter sp. MDT3-28]MCO4239086.1 DUF998 domain-containing protein [Pseudarthrobacter sp. MDT3-28]
MRSAPTSAPAVAFLPDTASTRQHIGAWSVLSVLQYFVAEAAVIGAWGGPQPYDRRTGYISDLGALHCGIYDGRDVCSPLHWLMNASFVVQGLGMLLGALLLGSGLLCVAARAGARVQPGRRKPWQAAVAVRVLTGAAGAGTMIVGLVPEDVGSGWHFVGALMYFLAGALALLLLGVLWLRQTPLGWFVLVCGLVSLAALVTGGLTGLDVPEPGTLERLMGYPVTVGVAAAGLVIAQRVHRHRKEERARVTGSARA